MGEGTNVEATAGPDAEMEARKDCIFRKVGRNVVNLQRLEQQFKTLLSLHVDAPLSKLPDTFMKNSEAFARQTMGPLTHEMIDRLMPEDSAQGTFEGLATEIWVKVSVGFEGDENLRRELRPQLKRLVDERNELVHHMFGGFDPRSEGSCSKLEQRLDAQRTHIGEVFNWVEELATIHKAHMQNMETWLENPEAFDR